MANKIIVGYQGLNTVNDTNIINSFNFAQIPPYQMKSGQFYGDIFAAAMDSSNNIYIASNYTQYDGVTITELAKWDGTSWSGIGSGPTALIGSATVDAIVCIGTDVYFAGSFNNIGGIAVNNIAKYNGGWSTVSGGLDGRVYALANLGGTLYAGGQFTDGIRKWNGSSWVSAGVSLSQGGGTPVVRCMTVAGTDLYVGGCFNTPYYNIAKFNGSTWSAVGNVYTNYSNSSSYTFIKSIGVVSSSSIYICGSFTTSSGNAASYRMYWNGSTWAAFGTSGTRPTQSYSAGAVIAYNATNIYFIGANGDQNPTGPTIMHTAFKWNGSAWSTLGANGLRMHGSSTTYRGGFMSGTTLYVYGKFYLAGSKSAISLATWPVSGSSDADWGRVSAYPTPTCPLSTYGGSGLIMAIVKDGSGNYYMGGDFFAINGLVANSVAKLSSGGAWSVLGLGIYGDMTASTGYVRALVLNGTDLYVGGNFTFVNGSNEWRQTAKYATGTSTWSALASNQPTGGGGVTCMAMFQSTLYAGSESSQYGLNKLVAGAWTAVANGTGLDDAWNSGMPTVSSLAVYNNKLYVGGTFKYADSSIVNNLAVWDGSAWNYVINDSGYVGVYDSAHDDVSNNSGVSSLAVIGSKLYVGGSSIAYAGATPVNNLFVRDMVAATTTNIDAWDVAGGTSNQVITMATYAGAHPLVVSGVRASGWLRQFNGTTWSDLASSATQQNVSGIYVDAPLTDVTAPSVGGSGNLNAFGVLYNRIILSWLKASDNTTPQSSLAYRVYYSTSSSMTSVALIEANGTPANVYTTDLTQLTITGLTASTTYYLNVIVKDEAGNKSAHNMLTQATPAAPDTTPPVAGDSGTITKSNVTGTGLTLNWTKATDSVSSQANLQYLAYYSLNSAMTSVANIEANGTAVGVYTADINTKAVTGLTEGNTYYLNVIVKDVAGNKAAYSQVSQLLDATNPTVGNSGIITKTSVTGTSLDLNWTKATDSVSSQANLQYLAYYSLNSLMSSVSDIETYGTAVGTYTADINTKAVTGLTSGSTYYFNVIVKDEAGNKATYSQVSQTLDGSAPTVGNSGIITTSGVGQTGVTLNWTKATDDISSQASLQYLAYYSTSSSFDTIGQVEAGTAVGTYTADINTKAVTGLTAATTYYFNVIVKDEVGNKAVYVKKMQATNAAETTVIDGDNSSVGNSETATWGSIAGGLTLTVNGEVLSGGEVVLMIASLDDLTGTAYFIEVKAGASLTFSGETIIPKSGTVYRLRPRT